jgi:ATP/maltotriose-dependent transcriptional regulator MalT
MRSAHRDALSCPVMLCTYCGGTTHNIEMCWVRHPEKKAAHLAAREQKRLTNAALTSELRNSATVKEPRSTARDVPLYQMAVGTAQWLAGTTHPEIGYSATQCAKHCSAPTTEHVQQVINLLEHCQQNKCHHCFVMDPQVQCRALTRREWQFLQLVCWCWNSCTRCSRVC